MQFDIQVTSMLFTNLFSVTFFFPLQQSSFVFSLLDDTKYKLLVSIVNTEGFYLPIKWVSFDRLVCMILPRLGASVRGEKNGCLPDRLPAPRCYSTAPSSRLCSGTLVEPSDCYAFRCSALHASW